MSLRRLPVVLISLALIAILALASYIYWGPVPAGTGTSATTVAKGPSNTAAPQTSGTAAALPDRKPATGTTVGPTATIPPVATIAPAEVDPQTAANLQTLDQDKIPERDPVELAVEYGRTTTEQRVAKTAPLDVKVGQRETFWMADLDTNRNYTSTATLVVALDHVLMYVEDGIQVNQAAIEHSAHQFNDDIYPRDRALFGEEWSPGVDGDTRLTVLNGRITGAGGYFSSSDEVPRSVNRFSNEREMFYMNIDDRPLGTATYASVLAHEFQHMIEWHQAKRSASWLNEGLSEMAEDLNGFNGGTTGPIYLRAPDLQLTAWAADPTASLPHYGASYQFLRYFYDQYGKTLDLKALIQGGAAENLDLFAKQAATVHPDIQHFQQLYGDWAVANLVNDKNVGDGRYTYTKLPFTVKPKKLQNGQDAESVSQFGSDYLDIPARNQPQTVDWQGTATTRIFPVDTPGPVWWSDRGDNADTVLSRTLDLSKVSSATLKFRLWYDTEKDFDYGFVAASTDGKHWQTLKGKYTTTTDPQNGNYGNGYNGKSGVDQGAGKPDPTVAAHWVDEQIDLTPFAGKAIALRWQMVTDDSYNQTGMLIDDIQVPEIAFHDTAAAPAPGWSAAGWVRIANQLPQEWELRLVRTKGNQTTVERLVPGADTHVQFTLAPGEHAVLVVAGATPHTNERANFTVNVHAQQ